MIRKILSAFETDFDQSFWLAMEPTLSAGEGFLNMGIDHPQISLFILRLTQSLQDMDSHSALELLWRGLNDSKTQSVFNFLLERHGEKKDLWLEKMFEDRVHTELCFLDQEERKNCLQRFDANFRHGTLKRAKVIKRQGLGFSCKVLEIEPQMGESEIRDQFLRKIKAVHPDLGGSHHKAQQILRAYQEIKCQLKKI